MFDFLPLTLIGITISKNKDNELKKKAVSIMWDKVIELRNALPLFASSYMHIPLSDKDNYIHHKNGIHEEFSSNKVLQQEEYDRFMEQAISFFMELERQKPYINKKLREKLRNYSSFLETVAVAARYIGVLKDDILFPWENENHNCTNSLNATKIKQYKKCTYGWACLQILEDEICKDISKYM